MKKTVLEIRFPNGDVFEVPAEVIAKARTAYYADVDGFKEGSPEWDEEFKHSMISSEIMDWVQNNMDWVDVKDHAVKVEKKKLETQYEEGWFEAEFDVKIKK